MLSIFQPLHVLLAQSIVLLLALPAPTSALRNSNTSFDDESIVESPEHGTGMDPRALDDVLKRESMLILRQSMNSTFHKDTRERNLLISLYMPDQGHPHLKETYAAAATNVDNPLISSVHVLLEAPGHACSTLGSKLSEAVGREVKGLSKMVCVMVTTQPTYGDLLRYARSNITTGTLLLANADIVFDETIAHVGNFSSADEAYVLSVKAPSYDGSFKEIFGSQCKMSATRCWSWAMSWDVFVMQTPLRDGLFGTCLEFPMNMLSAENLAAGALAYGAGLKLKNPCGIVNAWHWHCFSGKMHATKRIGADFCAGEKMHKSVLKTWPCRESPKQWANTCPGL